MGGYLAGRLRTRWAGAQADEVYFRDTAHGFLAWAVASLVTAALLTSTIGSIISGGVQAGAVAGGAVAAAGTAAAGGAAVAGSKEAAKSDSSKEPMGYFVDSLFRKDVNAAAGAGTPGNAVTSGEAAQAAAASSTEVTRIFANGIATGVLPPEDVRYVGQIVAQRTGLSQQEAEKRVVATFSQMQEKLRAAETAAKEAADKARKASAYAALWLFLSLLIGPLSPVFRPPTAGVCATPDAVRTSNSRRHQCVHCCCSFSAFPSRSLF
jgi:hypothetical protein